MADRTLRGTAVDARAQIIRHRRIQHEIAAMINTIDKYEIDILEAEQNIARTRESIEATHERIAERRAELAQFEGEGS